ncbi:putative L-asparaginase [Tirmania nivea]|nr:putative L-asparaginase [Tirmania nivea]
MNNSYANYSIVLHAGTNDGTHMNLVHQQAIEQALHPVAEAAGSLLASGGTALDAVQFAVRALEDCPLFNAGKGSSLTVEGTHELEAAIADGASQAYGAVACLKETKNPIDAARAVLESKHHVFLVGVAADEFARKSRLEMVPNDYFTTDMRRSHWELRKGESNTTVVQAGDLDTVGAVALDSHGHLAAAASTGGMTGKLEGRLGDAAIMGAGLFVNDKVAVVGSGVGEDILRHSVAINTAIRQESMSLDQAVRKTVLDMAEKCGQPCGIVALNSTGTVSIHSSGRLFSVASCSSTIPARASVLEGTIPLFPQHIFFRDHAVTAGLSRYPITHGQVIVTVNEGKPLTSLIFPSFLTVMMTVRHLSSGICAATAALRCGLATDGDGTLSVIPLHGLTGKWDAIIHDIEEFHETYPGFITSKNGPKMADSVLDGMQARICKISKLPKEYNKQFFGDAADQNLFARIIRGELQQWRVWEDNRHVAFLTPFGSSPGFTVLVPRQHLSSDIFQLEDNDYQDMIDAAYKVAQILKLALGCERCGMIFEGFEIDYAHIKLVPVLHESGIVPSPTEFFHEYPGFLTTQRGPRKTNFEELSKMKVQMACVPKSKGRTTAPKSWRNPLTHSIQALQNPWYRAIFALQDTLFQSSIDYFSREIGYKYMLLPATSDCISSPMGLGSDSQPVAVPLFGRNTYLVDSMQFALEYALRLEDELQGSYYIGTSFRGEDPDSTHLNQFYHVECELLGLLDDAISVAEHYIWTLTSRLLKQHRDIIEEIAGTTSHIDALLHSLKLHGNRLPRITLSDALSLPEMRESTWEYIMPGEPEKGRRVTRKGERLIVQKFGCPIWLIEPDHLSVPFYQAYAGNDNGKALCADLLFSNGEVLGLGQRHRSASQVMDALNHHQVPPESYAWYADIREYKALQTTGWGMGTERFLCWILQHDDIRDIPIIPRLKGEMFFP